ncbi:hypothetical protein [Streptomyces sp. NPDC048106]|uniref:hypothetical protein n=1 Tax=Streptomyces sp. NPDC048106 TaxID=3155750 RepID=UPI003452D0A5
MAGLDHQGPQRQLHVLRPLPRTEDKATFSVSGAVLGLTPANAAGMDLATPTSTRSWHGSTPWSKTQKRRARRRGEIDPGQAAKRAAELRSALDRRGMRHTQ